MSSLLSTTMLRRNIKSTDASKKVSRNDSGDDLKGHVPAAAAAEVSSPTAVAAGDGSEGKPLLSGTPSKNKVIGAKNPYKNSGKPWCSSLTACCRCCSFCGFLTFLVSFVLGFLFRGVFDQFHISYLISDPKLLKAVNEFANRGTTYDINKLSSSAVESLKAIVCDAKVSGRPIAVKEASSNGIIERSATMTWEEMQADKKTVEELEEFEKRQNEQQEINQIAQDEALTDIDREEKELEIRAEVGDTLTEKKYSRASSLRGDTAVANVKKLTTSRYDGNVDPNDLGSIVIFYHIFLPASKSGQDNALRIVEDQLQLIKFSHAAKMASEEKKWISILYVTVGPKGILTGEMMDDYCKKFSDAGETGIHMYCKPLEHVGGSFIAPHGTGQSSTLRHLFKHCLKSDAESRVVYLHNYGADMKQQDDRVDNHRYSLTSAPLSYHCLAKEAAESQCNVCGLTFFTQWTNHFPGNMFTAKCGYVKQLINPLFHEKTLESKVIGPMLEMRLKDQILTTYMSNEVESTNHFGLEGYADEHWIGSHPDLLPCDVDPVGSVTFYRKTKVSLRDLSWGMAPRHEGSPNGKNTKIADMLNKNDTLRQREYFYLPGHLLKWFGLYDKAPPADSWAWKWFADGDFWKAKVEKYGAQAVNMTTEPYFYPTLYATGGTSSFINSSFLKEVKEKVTVDHPSTGPGIFFDVFVGRKGTADEVKASISTVQKQIQKVAEAGHQTRLYYLTQGHSDLENIELCPKGVVGDKLECRPLLRHYKNGYRGEVIRQVHEFCQQYPTQKVVYLRNRPPEGANVTNDELDNLLSHATMAAASETCLNSFDDESQTDACNVCGLSFYTMPGLMMSGNMWAAPCSYVNKLLDPTEFVSRMDSYATKTLLEKVKNRINFGILKERVDRLGVAIFSFDHWVGSHPSLLPCDLTSQQPLSYWMSSPRQASDFSLTRGAYAHINGAPFEYDPEAEEKVRKDGNLRQQEFYFLAGNLLKWFTLYGDAPGESSWVWSFYPDGDRWRHNVEKHGSSVVQVVNSVVMR